jgi:asparaginyl-tRNA synthetase
LNIDITSIQWYLDLRKYGYFSSAGFGLGFERLIMYILDLENIRDAIPFPRVEGSLKF